MSKLFTYTCKIRPEWIDYNGHMQDAYYGLVFSYAVDALQDEVGFDADYRQATGCTIYLLEDHKYFLREVLEGQLVRVETRVLDVSTNRFHLFAQMFEQDTLVAVSELIEAHVQQKPRPGLVDMPQAPFAALSAAVVNDKGAIDRYRARPLKLHR